MRWLLIAAIAALVCLGTATVANSDDSGTTKIPGCAPQCLRPSLIEPGNLPAGKYRMRNFFASEMTLSFAKGWSSGRGQHRRVQRPLPRRTRIRVSFSGKTSTRQSRRDPDTRTA